MGSVEMEVRLVEIPELEVPVAARFGNFALVRKGRKTSTLGKDLAKFLLPPNPAALADGVQWVHQDREAVDPVVDLLAGLRRKRFSILYRVGFCGFAPYNVELLSQFDFNFLPEFLFGMFVFNIFEVIDFLGAIHLNSKKRRFDSVSAGLGLLRSLSVKAIRAGAVNTGFYAEISKFIDSKKERITWLEAADEDLRRELHEYHSKCNGVEPCERASQDGSPCFVKSNGLKRSLLSLELAGYQMGEAITGDSQEIDEVAKEWEHNLLQNMMDRSLCVTLHLTLVQSEMKFF
ncbi:hypothetical protein DVH24_025139 [Malus domestica]|uniref:Uncharacterized protein n=1 Tax=Malus domestica TaxID=3750 RepID=A0A498HJF4_MALDO|nr:hypothetical protein DVH24_025139 [Malus domestica]